MPDQLCWKYFQQCLCCKLAYPEVELMPFHWQDQILTTRSLSSYRIFCHYFHQLQEKMNLICSDLPQFCSDKGQLLSSQFVWSLFWNRKISLQSHCLGTSIYTVLYSDLPLWMEGYVLALSCWIMFLHLSPFHPLFLAENHQQTFVYYPSKNPCASLFHECFFLIILSSMWNTEMLETSIAKCITFLFVTLANPWKFSLPLRFKFTRIVFLLLRFWFLSVFSVLLPTKIMNIGINSLNSATTNYFINQLNESLPVLPVFNNDTSWIRHLFILGKTWCICTHASEISHNSALFGRFYPYVQWKNLRCTKITVNKRSS